MLSDYNKSLIKLAEELGWTVDSSEVNQRGLTFSKGNFRIWKSIHCGLHWRMCEYINEYAAHHKSFETCEEALKFECVEDISKGLSKHNLKVGQVCEYLSDVKKNLETCEYDDIYSKCKVLFAYGDTCQFIKIETEKHEKITIPEYDLKIN